MIDKSEKFYWKPTKFRYTWFCETDDKIKVFADHYSGGGREFWRVSAKRADAPREVRWDASERDVAARCAVLTLREELEDQALRSFCLNPRPRECEPTNNEMGE